MKPNHADDQGQRFMIVGVVDDSHEVQPCGYATTKDEATKMEGVARLWLRYVWTHVVDRWKPEKSPGTWGDTKYGIDEDGIIQYVVWDYYINGQHAGSVGDYSISWTAFLHTGDHISHIETKEKAMKIVEKYAVVGIT